MSVSVLGSLDRIQLKDILTMAFIKKASDVHLKAGMKPFIRLFRKLQVLDENLPVLSGEMIDNMVFGIMDEHQKSVFRAEKYIDFGYGISGVGRFRINVFRQRGTTRLVIRNIPHEIPSFGELHLPPVVEQLARVTERGLILVTGTTGSGKSTTLAAMIDLMNSLYHRHIVTIEDPIEYLIKDKKSIISQREIGSDAKNFSSSLRSTLRQDPDVILIGEMRDRETIEIALTAAETGHLVLSTLHTTDTVETINRILTVYEPHQQDQIRRQLASVLRAVISLRLAHRHGGQGLIPAVEILVNNARVKEHIEDPSRTNDLHKVIEESTDSWGMQSFDQGLMSLVNSKLIHYDEAYRLSSNPEDFALRHSGVARMDVGKWSTQQDLRQKSKDDWERLQSLELVTHPMIKLKKKNEKK